MYKKVILSLCRFKTPKLHEKGPSAISWRRLQPKLLLRVRPSAHRSTTPTPLVHRTGYYSLSCAPDRSLFTVLCTGHSYYSLFCAPDAATIHCPVHRTQLLFTVLCTGQSYYSLSCAPDSYYSLSCAPANSTLSAFSSVLSPFDFNFWEDFPET